MDRTTEATNEFAEHRNREMLLAIRRRWGTASDAQIDGSVSMRLPAIDDQPSASADRDAGMRQRSNSLRDLPDMATMEIEYGNRKEGSGGRYKEASPKLGHGIDGSRNPRRIHSSIRGFEKRESKTFSGSQLHSSEQNFQSDTGKEFFSRNGIDHNPRRNNTKNPINGFYSLDTYPRNGYLISHNTPILDQNVDAPSCAHAV